MRAGAHRRVGPVLAAAPHGTRNTRTSPSYDDRGATAHQPTGSGPSTTRPLVRAAGRAAGMPGVGLLAQPLGTLLLRDEPNDLAAGPVAHPSMRPSIANVRSSSSRVAASS